MPMDKRDCAFSPLRWINNVCSTTCFSLMSYAKNKAKARRPAGHIQTGGTMSEMRYADTNFLIVTCYLLLQGWKRCCAFALASLCLRFRFAPIDGASTDLQRIYNGPTTDLHWRITRAFFASLHRFPYLQVSHNTSLAWSPPNRAYPDGGTMSGMRYTDTKILIVTCYLLPQGWKCRCAFALASLCLRFRFAPIDGASTDLQRIYNGPGTDLERNCIGGDTRAFFASLHRFPCGVNEFGMMSTKSGLCNPFQENDNLSSIMSTNAV